MQINIKILKARYRGDYNKYYGIYVDSSIVLPCLLSVLFYCNYSNLCSKFRLSFYNNKKPYHYDWEEPNKEGESIEYYFLGRYLYCAVYFYGTQGYYDPSITFYHGLSSKMLFKSFGTIFASPTSVTTSLRVARQFATENGIVLILKSKFKGFYQFYTIFRCVFNK